MSERALRAVSNPRRVVKIVAWLVGLALGGAVTTFTLAVFVVWPLNPWRRVALESFPHDLDGDDYTDIWEYRRLGLREFRIQFRLQPMPEEPVDLRGVDATWERIRPLAYRGLVKSRSLDEVLAKRGTRAHYEQPEFPPSETVGYLRSEAGWPALAFRFESIFHEMSSEESSHLVLHFRNAGGLNVPMRVPIVPIWSGLAINTALFASFWSLVLFGPAGAIMFVRAWRRRSRIAAGLCPTCRYPGGHLNTCPECGGTA